MGQAGGVLLLKRLKRREIRAEGYRRGYRGGDLDELVAVISIWDDDKVNLTNSQTIAEFKAILARNTRRPR